MAAGRHRCKEQTFGLRGRRRGWDDLREYHWNIYITICKVDNQCEFDAGHPKLVLWDNLKGWLERKEGVGFRMEGTLVYLRPIHVDVWKKPSQYCNYTPIKVNKNFKKTQLLQSIKTKIFTYKKILISAIKHPQKLVCYLGMISQHSGNGLHTWIFLAH